MVDETRLVGGGFMATTGGALAGGFVRLRRWGGERRDGALGFGAPRGDQAAASCGVHQRWRRSAAIILGRRGHSVLWCCVRRSFFNLLAGVPN